MERTNAQTNSIEVGARTGQRNRDGRTAARARRLMRPKGRPRKND